MLRKIALATASIYALWMFAPAPAAHAAAGRCSTTLTPTSVRAATASFNCAYPDPGVHVRVDGHELVIATLSRHGNRATFYGRRSVVQLDDHGNRYVIHAATLAPNARVRIWLTSK